MFQPESLGSGPVGSVSKSSACPDISASEWHLRLGFVVAGGHVTRFIALASVGNPAKAKSLHALALTPAADMDIAVLTQRPDGTTPCPYELPNSSKRALNGQDEDAGGQAGLCQAVSHALLASQSSNAQALPYSHPWNGHYIHEASE